MARKLADRIGVALELREYPNPPGVVQALSADEIDVAGLGLDPARAAQVDFTPPYMKADFSFVVPQGSLFKKLPTSIEPARVSRSCAVTRWTLH